MLRVGNYWSAEGLRDPRPRLVRPDAVLELARHDNEGSRVFLIEYDRTRRVDKNYEKLRRYDTFLCWWWQHTTPRRTPFLDRPGKTWTGQPRREAWGASGGAAARWVGG